MELTNEQLQEICLEFAEFEYVPDEYTRRRSALREHNPSRETETESKLKCYEWPKGSKERKAIKIWGENLPNFTESVDAHVKWTLPELVQLGYRYKIELIGALHFFDVTDPLGCELYPRVAGDEKSLALAICKAVAELRGSVR